MFHFQVAHHDDVETKLTRSFSLKVLGELKATQVKTGIVFSEAISVNNVIEQQVSLFDKSKRVVGKFYIQIVCLPSKYPSKGNVEGTMKPGATYVLVQNN